MAKEQGKRASGKAGVTLSHISPKLLIKTVTLISGYEEIYIHTKASTSILTYTDEHAHTHTQS